MSSPADATTHAPARAGVQTRQEVLDTLAGVFLEHGYAGATLGAIARASDVVVETIYRTSASKAGLFKASSGGVAGGATRAEVRLNSVGHPCDHCRAGSAPPADLVRRTQPGIHAAQDRCCACSSRPRMLIRAGRGMGRARRPSASRE